jgi:prolipoprotein diacylglyceryl transferase
VSVLPSVLPLSIPSPPLSWQGFAIPVGQWLHLGGAAGTWAINVKTYAFCLLVGMVVAAFWTSRRLNKRGAEKGVTLDFAIGAVVGGIIGARVYHVLTHYNDYFGAGKNPWTAFAIWEGGIAIFGSIIGGSIGILVVSRLTGVKFWSFADALIPGLLLAQALGRFGNYFNHELYGQPTNLPWGLVIEKSNAAYPIGLPAGTLFHPTFLYEMLWNALGIAVLLLLERQYRFQWGKMAALYFIWYGIGRVWFESIRIDPSDVFLGLRTNVWGAIVSIVVGIVIFAVQTRRHPGVEPSVYIAGREWVPPVSTVDSDETYSDSDETGDGAELSPEIAATSGAGA